MVRRRGLNQSARGLPTSLITLFSSLYSKDYYAFLDEEEADKLANKSRK